MQDSDKISVVINTYNAREHLERVLETVKEFDEVLVCDMESTDDTVEIAKRYGCRVVTFPKGDYNICEPARDFAIHSARYPWVLLVDADELVTPELREYLYKKIRDGWDIDGVALGRTNMFLGKPATGSPDYQMRFFKRDKTTWPPIIHARPRIDGKTVNMPAGRKELFLKHLDDLSITERIAKMNRYSGNEVPKRLHKRYGAIKMLFRPGWFFLRSWLFQGGFKDGKRGIIKAYMAAMYQMMLISKVTEKQMEVPTKEV